MGPNFDGRGGHRGSAMVRIERPIVVVYWLANGAVAVSLTIRRQFSIECLRRSNQQGVGLFGAKFGEKWVDRCKATFNAIWKRHSAVVCKRNRVDIFCRSSTMQERNRQTDRPLNGNVDTNRRNRSQ